MLGVTKAHLTATPAALESLRPADSSSLDRAKLVPPGAHGRARVRPHETELANSPEVASASGAVGAAPVATRAAAGGILTGARTRRLGAEHFAFMRAVVQGLDLRESWDRYLRVDGDSRDVRRIHATITWIRDEFAAAAHREARHGIARLVRIDTRLLADEPRLPSLEEFAAARGMEEFSQAEQTAAYADALSQHVGVATGASGGLPTARALGRLGARWQRRQRLVARQLDALRWLETLVVRPPAPEDAVQAWLHPDLARLLAGAGVLTLAQLVERINGLGLRWYRGVRSMGAVKAQRVLDWVRQHEQALGLRIGAHVVKPRRHLDAQALQAVVVTATATAIRPLEKFVVPASLDGRHGSFRCPKAQCLLSADTDYEAILAWLNSKQGTGAGPRTAGIKGEGLPQELQKAPLTVRAAVIGRSDTGRLHPFETTGPSESSVDDQRLGPRNGHGKLNAGVGQGAEAGSAHCADGRPGAESVLAGALSNTQRAYRKEVERLLLWATLQQGKALSSMTHEDCLAYCEFMADPQPREQWCGPRSRERWSPLWRPFEGPLSITARRHAITVLAGFYRFLEGQGYLMGNPWSGVRLAGPAKPVLNAGRSLSVEQWRWVQGWLAQGAPTSAHRRLGFAFRLAHATGLRPSELCAARVDDLRRGSYAPQSNEPGVRAISGWVLRVEGKGQRVREVPVPDVLIEELQEYLCSRGLEADPLSLRNRGAYLLGRARDADQRAPGLHATAPGAGGFDPHAGIATTTLYDQMVACFAACSRARAQQGDAAGARRLAQASTHWLRHSHARHALAEGVPLEVIQQNLGHASIETTKVYVRVTRGSADASAGEALGNEGRSES